MPEIVPHSAIVSAVGNTVIWTPAAGFRFRLLAYTWTYATFNAVQPLISLQDGGAIITYVASIPATGAGAVGATGYAVLPGEGYISSADNNVLNVNSNGAGAGIALTVWGWEE